MRIAKFVKYLAFTVMLLFGVFGSLFAAGYAFEDPGGWASVGMVAAQLIPFVILAVVAVRKSDWAVPVFVVITIAVSGLNIIDSAFRLLDRNASALSATLQVSSCYRYQLSGSCSAWLAC